MLLDHTFTLSSSEHLGGCKDVFYVLCAQGNMEGDRLTIMICDIKKYDNGGLCKIPPDVKFREENGYYFAGVCGTGTFSADLAAQPWERSGAGDREGTGLGGLVKHTRVLSLGQDTTGPSEGSLFHCSAIVQVPHSQTPACLLYISTSSRYLIHAGPYSLQSLP